MRRLTNTLYQSIVYTATTAASHPNYPRSTKPVKLLLRETGPKQQKQFRVNKFKTH